MNYDKMYDCVYVCSMRFQWQMQQKPEIAACNDIQLSYGSIESVCLVDRFFSLSLFFFSFRKKNVCFLVLSKHISAIEMK